jgi:Na+-driven multidrug efflux pump
VSNVIYACLLIFLIPAEALSETAVSLVSTALGRGQREQPRALVRRISVVAAGATVPMALVAVVAPGAVFSILFGVDQAPDAAELALRIVAGGLGFGVPWLVWMGGLQGTGDTLASSVIDSSVSVLILGWAATAAFVLDGGVAEVRSGIAVAWFVGLIAAVLWMRSDRWHRVTV